MDYSASALDVEPEFMLFLSSCWHSPRMVMCCGSITNPNVVTLIEGSQRTLHFPWQKFFQIAHGIGRSKAQQARLSL